MATVLNLKTFKEQCQHTAEDGAAAAAEGERVAAARAEEQRLARLVQVVLVRAAHLARHRGDPRAAARRPVARPRRAVAAEQPVGRRRDGGRGGVCRGWLLGVALLKQAGHFGSILSGEVLRWLFATMVFEGIVAVFVGVGTVAGRGVAKEPTEFGFPKHDLD